jgi:hypothetical protein
MLYIYKEISFQPYAMNRIIYFISIIVQVVILSELKAQYSYEFIISNPAQQHIIDCVEDQYGNVYIVGDNVYVENSQITHTCGSVYKIDPEGNILMQREFCYPDTMLYFLEVDMIQDSLFVFGSSGAVEVGFPDLFVTYILNQDLDVINYSKRRLFLDKYLGGMNHLLSFSGDIVVLSEAMTLGEIIESDILFYKFTKNMDSLLCTIDIQAYNQMGMDFVQDPITKGFKVFGHGTYPNTVPSYDELVKFDSNFNFISVDSVAWKLRGQHTFKWLTDSTYLLTGNKNFAFTYYTNIDIGVVILNCEDELLDAASFGKSVDTVDYAGVKDNLDFVTKDNIFYGGTSNFIVNQWPWQTDDSWIYLINLDSNLNVNWQRYYGGDAFYHLYGLLATQDGGCFMYACRYDENTQFQEYDIYILKVDSNGLLSSVNDIPNIATNELFIYPNPASIRITVQFPGVSHLDHKELLIYNSLGIKVKHMVIPSSTDRLEMDLENLSSGLYYISLISNGTLAATGRLLISR